MKNKIFTKSFSLRVQVKSKAYNYQQIGINLNEILKESSWKAFLTCKSGVVEGVNSPTKFTWNMWTSNGR